MKESNLIENLKIALIYGKSPIDGIDQDGILEKIQKYDEDTAHYFYMNNFLKNHFKSAKSIQEIINKQDVNSIFFEIQKLGHIVFAENTSNSKHPSGLMYIPKSISQKQKHTLKLLQNELKKNNYNITALINLFRAEDGVLMGNQIQGTSNILNKFTENSKLVDKKKLENER